MKLYTLNNKFLEEVKKIPYNFTGVAITEDQAIFFYENGLCHRENGPAVIWDSLDQFWYINNKRHRIGGPAFIDHYGTKQWWVDGIQITELEHDLLYSIMKLKGLI
jgi:hypothetical protein